MNNLKVWASGGYFDDTGECFIQEIDVIKKTCSDVIQFVPEENLFVKRKGFTGATWVNLSGKSDLLVCGYCSLYRFSPPDWKLTGFIHQPCMNDLHHVSVHNDRIFLVNTGLETIDLFELSGSFIGSYSFHPSWINKERQKGINPSTEDWQKLLQSKWSKQFFPISDHPPTEDYYNNASPNFHQRKLRDFIHLNHVTILPHQILATSLSHRCIYNLSNFAKIIETPGYPHDGFVHKDNFWITCVDGTIVAYKIKQGMLTDKIVYFKNIFDHVEYKGWCRGIMVKDDYLIVGITKIRNSTQFKWIDYPWELTKTGLICWDLAKDRLVSFVDMSIKRHSKVFSIIDAAS